MDVRLEHPEKTPLSKDVTPSGMVMVAKLEHPEKAKNPIDVTLSGMVIVVRKEQFSNA